MRVRYFIEIINELLRSKCPQAEIAEALGFKKQNLTEILSDKRQNLKDEHLPGLIKLCRKYGVGPQTAAALMRRIETEKKAVKK